MTNKFIIYLFILILSLTINHQSLIINPVQAIESTPSSSLQDKIDSLKKEIASKAANFKKEVDKKMQNRAFIGQIKEKSANKFIINTFKNSSRTILTNDYTVYQNKSIKATKKNALSLKDLQENDFVVALGDIDDRSILTAKKIIKFTPVPGYPGQTTQAVLGYIESYSPTSMSLKTTDNKKLTLKITNGTSVNLGNEESALSSLKPNQLVAAVTESSSSANLRFIYILPQRNSQLKSVKPQPQITSTPSGKTSPQKK